MPHGPPPGERPTRLRPEHAVSQRTCCPRPGVSVAASLTASLQLEGPRIADHVPVVTAAGVHPCCQQHVVALRCLLRPDGCCHRLPVETCRAKKRRNAWPTSPQSSEAAALLRPGEAASRSTGATGWHSLFTPARRTPSVTRAPLVSGHTLSQEMPLADSLRAVHDTKRSGIGETARPLGVVIPRSTGTQ